MKYLNIILTIIAMVLASISLRLFSIGILLEHLEYNSKLSINSNQALINANKHLEDEIFNLRKQVETLSASFIKK